MYTDNSAALLPIRYDPQAVGSAAELIFPIRPAPVCITLFPDGVPYEADKVKGGALRDFLYAFFLGLSVFGIAAVIALREILSIFP